MKNNSVKSAIILLVISIIIHMFIPNILYSQDAKIRVIKKDAVLRLLPNNDSLAIKDLPAGAMLDAVETMGEWIKVKLPPDKDGITVTGYVHSSFVTFELKPSQPEPTKEGELPIRKSEAYIQWQNKLANEKSAATSGLVIGLTGAAASIAFGILAFTDKKHELEVSWSSISYREQFKPGYLIGGGLGLLTFVVGIAQYSNAKNNINQLESEGRIEGYITAGVLPKYKAVGVQISVSF